MQYIRDLSTGRHPQGDRRRAPGRLHRPDREQPGAARLRRPARGLLRRGRDLRADGRREVQHQLVPEVQLPALPVQQPAGAGQRARVDRRRGPRAGPARGPPRRLRRRAGRGHLARRPDGGTARRAPRKGPSSPTRPARRASITPAGGTTAGSAFAVNQFDARESDLAPRGLVPEGVPAAQADAYKIKIGYSPVAGTPSLKPSRKDWWKPLAALALGVVLVEWYIYNRRVYI